MKIPIGTPAEVTQDRRRTDDELRAAFLAGAEQSSWRVLDRGLTDEELRRVRCQCTGDLPTT